jgi:pantetheine-phosphate adenylyltransferase
VTRAVCPGSFDPPTLGHLDVIGRAGSFFDELTVAVLVNPDKRGMFSVEERVELLRSVTAEWPHVRVDAFQGLLVDYCRDHAITAIVKGIRAVSDFDYELQMAQMNQRLAGVDTFFLPASPAVSFLSSSLVKQIAVLGGDVAELLPPAVHAALVAKLA